MRKIVICPIFCDTHLIKYQIPNIIDTIDPDIIIYNEGAFPFGPEGSTDPDFLKKYTVDGKRGFDYEELEAIIKNAQDEYNTEIILNPKTYIHKDASDNYIDGCTNFDEVGIKIERGDLIFPYEGDVFHNELDKYILDDCCRHLKQDEGFTTSWIDFIGTQYYLHCADISRKICIKYGTQKFYETILGRFQKQRYRDLLYHVNLTTYHMSWFRPTKYRQMRYDQLNRAKEYWATFEKGIQKIIETGSKRDDNIVIRDRKVGGSFTKAYYFDGPWPKALKGHECFI